jgi:hypothetical protein
MDSEYPRGAAEIAGSCFRSGLQECSIAAGLTAKQVGHNRLKIWDRVLVGVLGGQQGNT